MSISKGFSENIMEKRKSVFQRAKELRQEEKLAKVVYDRIIARYRRSRLENAERGRL